MAIIPYDYWQYNIELINKLDNTCVAAHKDLEIKRERKKGLKRYFSNEESTFEQVNLFGYLSNMLYNLYLMLVNLIIHVHVDFRFIQRKGLDLNIKD